MKLDVIRDILDKQLIDRSERNMGRADGVVLAIREGEQPQVDHLQLGGIVLARRLHPSAVKMVEWFRHRWRVRHKAIQAVHWPEIAEITRHDIKLNIEAKATEAEEWERWLREHIIEKIPGSKK